MGKPRRRPAPWPFPWRVHVVLALVLMLHLTCTFGKTIFVTEDGVEETDEEGGEEEDEGEGEDIQQSWQTLLQVGLSGIKKSSSVESGADGGGTSLRAASPPVEWNEFDGDLEEFLEQELDPGAWKPAVEAPLGDTVERADAGDSSALYALGIKRMLGAQGVARDIPLAIKTLQLAADLGHCHAQSALAFLHASGYGVPLSDVKGFLYHAFGAGEDSFESKMALAYSFLRQQEYEHAVHLYAKVAAKTVATNHILGDAPLVETVRLNAGGEENREAIRGHRGEDDETIQYVVYTAWNGNVHSLRTLGNLYYWGARGLPRDPRLALDYFKKAAEQGDAHSMVNLGEMYARGLGVERDPQLARKWFLDAAQQGSQHAAVAAANGLGYLYARGLGVEQNYTKALEHFSVAAKRQDAEGQYYLAVMHLRGLGVPRSAPAALRLFAQAADKSHLAAVYQLAKMNHKGIGTRQNFHTAAALYKAVAERGPWGALLRWAHTRYMDGDVGTALLLYSRAAELGYEVAQSNAAWLLDKFHADSGCVGAQGGRCTAEERHARAHRLWRHASEQGNVQAALLIGDAYFYGKGTKKDLERAVEAYRRAKDKRNAQAMFNLGYMHQHGLGLPLDLHLAKRFYDEALETDPEAELPVKLALAGLWLRLHHPDSALVALMDTLPEVIPRTGEWVRGVFQDEGNVTVLTLLALLGAVLYLRQRHRQPIHAPPVGQ